MSPAHHNYHSPDPAEILGGRTLDLLGYTDTDQLVIINPWRRAGAETYCTDFVMIKDGIRHHLLAKACVNFFPRETVLDWLKRRQLLETSGVSVPQLFLVDGATIVEEYIPYGFKEAFSASNKVEQQVLHDSFINAYYKIIQTGFRPLSLHDIRSRGYDSVVVDMGHDLGPPQPGAPSTKGQTLLEAERAFRTLVN